MSNYEEQVNNFNMKQVVIDLQLHFFPIPVTKKDEEHVIFLQDSNRILSVDRNHTFIWIEKFNIKYYINFLLFL